MQITWNYTIKPCVLFNVDLVMEKHWCVCVCAVMLNFIFLYRTVIFCVFRVQCSDRHTGGDRQQFLQWFIQSVWMCLFLIIIIIMQCVCNSNANLCEVKRVNHSNQGLPVTREIQTCPFITQKIKIRTNSEENVLIPEQKPWHFWTHVICKMNISYSDACWLMSYRWRHITQLQKTPDNQWDIEGNHVCVSLWCEMISEAKLIRSLRAKASPARQDLLLLSQDHVVLFRIIPPSVTATHEHAHHHHQKNQQNGASNGHTENHNLRERGWNDTEIMWTTRICRHKLSGIWKHTFFSMICPSFTLRCGFVLRKLKHSAKWVDFFLRWPRYSKMKKLLFISGYTGIVVPAIHFL